MKKALLLLLPLLLQASAPCIPIESPKVNPCSCNLNEKPSLLFDPCLSPYAGAHLVFTLHDEIESCLPFKKIDNPSLFYLPLRAATLYFFWCPVNYLGMLIQHEVFGHGYRIRSGTGYVTNYEFHVPPPYGNGGGSTHYQLYNCTPLADLFVIYTGGMEATAHLAHMHRMKMMQNGCLDPFETSLYIYSQHDMTNYAFTTCTDSEGKILSGHDIGYYVDLLKDAYLKEEDISESRILRTLQRRVLLNFLDPFTYLTTYASFRYIITGSKTPLPTLSLFKSRIGYFPGVHINLTPFGPETQFDNYLLLNKSLYHFYYRNGHFAGMHYSGFGLSGFDIYRVSNLSFGFTSHFWTQPKLPWLTLGQFDEGASVLPLPQRVGFAASLIVKLFDPGLGERLPTVSFEAGLKSKGYVPALALRAGPILRLTTTLPF